LTSSLANATLFSLSSVLGYLYARRHGYDIRVYELVENSCRHPLLGLRRTQSWCKVPALWDAAEDSDARLIVSCDPNTALVAHNRRLEDWLAENLTSMRRFGVPPLEADMTLLSDHAADWYCRKGIADTAFFVAKGGPSADRLLRRWWDVFDPKWASGGSLEKNALGSLVRARDGKITTVCTSQFEFQYFSPDSFVYHGNEESVFRTAITHAGVLTEAAFGSVITEMREGGFVRTGNASAIAVAMAKRTAADPVFYLRCEDDKQCRDDGRERYNIRNDCVDRSDSCVPPQHSALPASLGTGTVPAFASPSSSPTPRLQVATNTSLGLSEALSRLFAATQLAETAATDLGAALLREPVSGAPWSARPRAPAHAIGEGIAIVMSDSRPLMVDGKPSIKAMAAAVNYLFAMRHGYDFVMHQLSSNQCTHEPLRTVRMNGWCKLPPLWGELNRTTAAYVVACDSDCAFVGDERRFEPWFSDDLATMRRFGKPPLESDITFLSDYFADPYCLTGYANTGLTIVRAGAVGERLVRMWWNVNDTLFSSTWPFEQNSVGALLRDQKGAITTVCSKVTDFQDSSPNSFVYHGKKLQVFQKALARAGVRSLADFEAVLAEMRTNGAIRVANVADWTSGIQQLTAEEPIFPAFCEDGKQCRRNATHAFHIRNDCSSREECPRN
jgi:hypothetical protein